MARKFRPLEDSIRICAKMIVIESGFADLYGDEFTTDALGNKITVVEYWNKRLHGYQKLLNARLNPQNSSVYQPRSSSK